MLCLISLISLMSLISLLACNLSAAMSERVQGALQHRQRGTPRGPGTNMAHIRQSKPDYGLGFCVRFFKSFQVVPSSLGRGVTRVPHVQLSPAPRERPAPGLFSARARTRIPFNGAAVRQFCTYVVLFCSHLMSPIGLQIFVMRTLHSWTALVLLLYSRCRSWKVIEPYVE